MKRSSYSLARITCGLLLATSLWTTPTHGQLFQKLFGDKKNERQEQELPANRQPVAPQAPRQARRPDAPSSASPSQTRPEAGGEQAPQEPPVAIEEATAERRAEFSKLIGADWIWSPAHEKDDVPESVVYFRKTLTLEQVEFGQVHICADNQYELFVNGQAAGSGNDWRKMEVHDIKHLLRAGRNVVAVKVANTERGAAGLVARVLTREPAGTFESHSTDDSWKTSVKQFRDWSAAGFRDGEWLPAEVYGALGATLPWGDEVVIAEEGARFVVDPEFLVERMTTDEQTGSLVAMTFDAGGNILASQEGGPLLLVRDRDGDGSFESVDVFSDQVDTAQGILTLGPQVFVVGNGPQGSALYRLEDTDRDGTADTIDHLVPMRGSGGEHGPHAVRLGPDGLLYVMIGNFAQADVQPSPQSPYQTIYEGDLVRPRYEDPRGHAVDVPAPGGTVIRTDTRGSFVEVVAGGLRNAYDFAFNPEGELFTFDADMEWDLGAPWYRPTRVVHVPPGGEFGWRSGWAKWPSEYLDSLPGLVDLGGGSPTGVEYYDHVKFPVRLQNTLLVGDWARGLIHAVKLHPDGAGYKATTAVFLKGRPLNVTDMAVGPDGALYFATGGRGTDGGIYRVRWKGEVPREVTELGNGIDAALQQPQFDADWARAKISAVKQDLGSQWGRQLTAAARDTHRPVEQRRRAVDLLEFYGPAPADQLLLSLARDGEPALRTHAARLMGMSSAAEFAQPLASLLTDSDARVRRVACEAIAHRDRKAPVDKLVDLLADDDRLVAFAARRALEGIPADQWQSQVLTSQQTRTFLQGATGLLVAQPSPQVATEVLGQIEAILRGEVQRSLTKAELMDMLRVTELALLRGKLNPQQVPGLANALVERYPTDEAKIDRELVKLLAYLGPPQAPARFAAQLASDLPEMEKLQIAAYAPRLREGWQTGEKLAFLRYYETVRDLEGGYSVSAYVEKFARDFFTNLSLAERRQVLASGEHYPTSALSVLARLPDDAGPEVFAEIRTLDQKLDGMEGDVYDRLRVGIVATLGKASDPESIAYLHEIYQTQPQRRAPVAMSLTQNPSGENWNLLVDSLRSIDGIAASDVLYTLARVDQRPDSAEPYRHVILQGLRQSGEGGDLAVELLEHWSGQPATTPEGVATNEQLGAWQRWYRQNFPDALPAELPQESVPSKWSYTELLSFLESPEGSQGDASRGAQVFEDAKCLDCHRLDGQGERLGPDLTDLAGRFQLKEVLESIVYPSHVISDQYASRAVVAGGRTYVGIAMRDGQESVVVLTSSGEKVRLAYDDVEEVRASGQSAMPEGLLNPLSLSEVADLFALLMDRPATNVAGREVENVR